MFRVYALIALFAATGAPSAATAATVGAKKPNVLFLVTDDQRADTIGALGNPVIKTPNLDKLVRRGFVFRNAYCMGSTMPAVCNPSRHMLLSGKSLYRYKAARISRRHDGRRPAQAGLRDLPHLQARQHSAGVSHGLRASPATSTTARNAPRAITAGRSPIAPSSF